MKQPSRPNKEQIDILKQYLISKKDEIASTGLNLITYTTKASMGFMRDQKITGIPTKIKHIYFGLTGEDLEILENWWEEKS